MKNRYLRCLVGTLISGLMAYGCQQGPPIVSQSFTMQVPAREQLLVEDILPGEIFETQIRHVAYAGPASSILPLSPDHVEMLLFIKGRGVLETADSSFALVPESIAIPMSYDSVRIRVDAGDTLHYLRFTKELTEKDLADLESFPPENSYDMYFTEFVECEAYTEAIKSPNTISRTVLPKDIVPRISLGTVEAPGPDKVGAHEHPMLDQLFLGLSGNQVLVHADGTKADFGEYELLHIPIGSSHGVHVEGDQRMYYMWMDFFLTREGQEWLKTHKPVSEEKDY